MQRFKYSILAAVGILVLSSVLIAVGPKRVMAALGYTPVRDVDNPGRQPFATVIFPNGNGGTATFTVPAGKRLVLTTFSATMPSATGNDLRLNTTVNGIDTLVVMPYTTRGSISYANLTGEALAHADPGTTVTLYNFGASVALATIHGYYVDVP